MRGMSFALKFVGMLIRSIDRLGALGGWLVVVAALRRIGRPARCIRVKRWYYSTIDSIDDVTDGRDMRMATDDIP